MSKVKIKGNSSGTGVLTIEAPNTNTDRTITLPDGTGTLLNSDGDGSSLTGISAGADTSLSNLSATGDAKVCKAWVDFTGGASVNDSHNVSSVTDLGTGQYQVNVTSAFSNTDFAAVATAANMSDASPEELGGNIALKDSSAKATGWIKFVATRNKTGSEADGYYDPSLIDAIFFGD